MRRARGPGLPQPPGPLAQRWQFPHSHTVRPRMATWAYVVMCSFALSFWLVQGLLPTHSYDHIPLFLHIRFANFSELDYERMARNFSMVTLQPYTPFPPLGEGQAALLKSRIQAVNSAVPVLLYFQAFYMDPLYSFTKEFNEHPSWWLYDDGQPYKPGGRRTW